MKKLSYIIIPIVLVAVSSCHFLETNPLDFLSTTNYYSSEKELQTALNGVYDILGQSALYGNYIITTSGDMADEGFYANKSTIAGPMVCNVSISDAKVLAFWQALYQGISRANFLLENIDKPDSVAQRDVIRGEALFLRAYYYFLLVSNFGDVPLILHSVTSPEASMNPRTPSTEVYRQIVHDMELAETLVHGIKDQPCAGRITKSSVRGILARVNLYWAGYPLCDHSRYAEAKKWAEKVMLDSEAQHRLNPNYRQIFINHAINIYDIKECIWEVEFWSDGTGNYKEYGRVGCNNGIITTNEEIGYAYGYVNEYARLYRSYAESDTLRRDWVVAPFKYNNSTKARVYFTDAQLYNRNCGKWRREYETITPKIKGGTPQNFPVLRYADVLLMYAEAENAINGPTADAYAALNAVRRRGYGVDLGICDAAVADAPSGMNQSDFLSFIQDERSRELGFECLRKRDLIRWGIYVSSMKKVSAEIEVEASSGLRYGSLAGKNVSEKDLLLPIPDYERSCNHLLTQNPGY